MRRSLLANNRFSKLVLFIFLLGAVCASLALLSKNSTAEFDSPVVNTDWSGAVKISNAPFGAYKPVIRYAPTSNALLIVYDQQMSSELGNNDPYSAISLNNGTTWKSAPVFTTSGKSDQVKGLVDFSNNAFSVWMEHTTSTNPNVDTLAFAIKPDIVINPNNLEADWKKGNITTFSIGPGQLLRDPNIALGSNNTVHVVWIKEDLGQTSIYYAYRTVNNNFGGNYDTWSDPILIPTQNPGPPLAEPAIAVDENGKIHIAWQEEPIPGEIEIRYMRGTLSGGVFTADPGRSYIKLSPDALQEAVLPVLYAAGSQLHVVFSNQQNGGEFQSALYAACTLPCNNLASSNFKTVTGNFVSSNDTDPYLLFTDIGYDAEHNSAHVYFHGDDGVAANSNELIMGVSSCDNWLTRERATDGAAYRAIRPTIAIKNAQIFLAYDKIEANNHQIYVQNRPLDCSGLVYLPIIIKK